VPVLQPSASTHLCSPQKKKNPTKEALEKPIFLKLWVKPNSRSQCWWLWQVLPLGRGMRRLQRPRQNWCRGSRSSCSRKKNRKIVRFFSPSCTPCLLRELGSPNSLLPKQNYCLIGSLVSERRLDRSGYQSNLKFHPKTSDRARQNTSYLCNHSSMHRFGLCKHQTYSG